MGFINWMREKKQKQSTLNSQYTKEWIEVTLAINFGREFSRKKVAEIGVDILEIFINARSVYNIKGQYLGYINPKTNKNKILTYSKLTKELYQEPLSKQFFPKLRDIENGTKLIFEHKGKYSLPALYHDLWILWNICEDVMNLYKNDIAKIPTFNCIFINGKPAIECFEKILKFRYLVEDRLKYGEAVDKEMTEKCLNASVGDFLNQIKENKFFNKNTKLNKDKAIEIKLWTEQVEKILK